MKKFWRALADVAKQWSWRGMGAVQSPEARKHSANCRVRTRWKHLLVLSSVSQKLDPFDMREGDT